jgi:hypothetical protein
MTTRGTPGDTFCDGRRSAVTKTIDDIHIDGRVERHP